MSCPSRVKTRNGNKLGYVTLQNIHFHKWEDCKRTVSALIEIRDYVVRKALVSLAIERALIDMGTSVFEQVTKKLAEECNCYISDCYDHPVYLKKVLKNFGNSYLVIVESIKENLKESSDEKSISEFLSVIECRESQVNQLIIKSHLS